MRMPIVGTSLIALLAVPAPAMSAAAAGPEAVMSEAFRLDARLALEPRPLLEAPRPRDLKSPGLSVLLSVGTPYAVSSLGAGMMLLSGYPTQLNAMGIAGMAVAATSPLALGAGQAYSGDPKRGLWVGLGTYGVLIGSTLLGLGLAYALDPQGMAAGGQSAGMGYALLALPLSSLVTVGYTLWALADAHQTAILHNEAVSAPMP